MKPVSVVIPAHNEDQYILDALESVTRQTYGHLIRKVIVVDDGSDDDTPELVGEYARQEAVVELVRQANQGLAAARNTGIRESDTEWVCFLDADDRWVPEKIETQWTAAARHPDVELWYSDLWKFGDQEHRVRVRGLPDERQQALVQYFRRDCPIVPSTVMVRRRVFLNVGMFDSELRYAQDTEMWARIIARHPVRRIPEPLVYRRMHAESLGSDVFKKAKYKRLVTHKLVRQFPVLEEHVGGRNARYHLRLAIKYIDRGYRGRAFLKAKEAISADPTVYESYVVLMMSILSPCPDRIRVWIGRVRNVLRDILNNWRV